MHRHTMLFLPTTTWRSPVKSFPMLLPSLFNSIESSAHLVHLQLVTCGYRKARVRRQHRQLRHRSRCKKKRDNRIKALAKSGRNTSRRCSRRQEQHQSSSENELDCVRPEQSSRRIDHQIEIAANRFFTVFNWSIATTTTTTTATSNEVAAVFARWSWSTSKRGKSSSRWAMGESWKTSDSDLPVVNPLAALG